MVIQFVEISRAFAIAEFAGIHCIVKALAMGAWQLRILGYVLVGSDVVLQSIEVSRNFAITELADTLGCSCFTTFS